MVAKVWKGVAVALAVALGASACGTDSKGSGATLEEMIFAIDSPTVGFDPNVTPAAQDARIMRQVFDGLVSKDENGKIVAGLAKEWKVSEDGLSTPSP